MVGNIDREASAWSGSGQNFEPSERAAWLGAFTLRGLLWAMLAAHVLGLGLRLADLVLRPSSFDRTFFGLGWIQLVLTLAATVGLAALTRTRLFVAGAATTSVLTLMLGANIVLALSWSAVSLRETEVPITALVAGALTLLGLVRVVAPYALGYSLALIALGLDVALTVVRINDRDPFARHDALVFASYAPTIALLTLALVRPRRLPPRPLSAMRAPGRLAALSGLWLSPFLMLAASWFVLICGALSTRLATTMQAALVGVDVLCLFFVARGARALLGVGVPTSVSSSAIIAVVGMAVGCALSLAGLGMVLFGNELRGPANLASMRELAQPLSMSAAIASCYAVSLAARWTGVEVEQRRASLAARLGLATFLMVLPPLATAAREGRTLGALALDASWLAGIIMLWKAVEGVRPALARRALVDAL